MCNWVKWQRKWIGTNINSWTWIGIYVVPIHFQSPKKHFSQLDMSRPVILSTHTTFLLFNYVIKWKNILPDDNDNDIIIKSFDQNIDFTNFLYTYLYLSNHFVFFSQYIFQILQIQYRLLQGLLQWLIGEIVWVPLKTTFWDLHVSIVESSKVKQVGLEGKSAAKKKFFF